MSYGSLALSGISRARSGAVRSAGSVASARGGWSAQLCGMKETSRRTCSKHSSSVPARKWATPERTLCTSAPPSSSKVTLSPVVTRITSGPVMNM